VDRGVHGGGKYVGFRTRDTFTLRGPDAGAPCFATGCVTTATYDPRGRLTDADTGYGFTAHFDLDPAGNVLKELATVQGQTSTRYYGYGNTAAPLAPTDPTAPDRAFVPTGNQKANQLSTYIENAPPAPGQTQPQITKHQLFNDPYAALDCITTDAWTGSACPAHPTLGGERDPVLRFDYLYDDFQRLTTARAWAVDAGVLREVDEGRTSHDVLDRPTAQQESHNYAGIDPTAPLQRTTTFSHLGLTNAIAQEVVSGVTATPETKEYRFGALGERTTLNAGEQRYAHLGGFLGRARDGEPGPTVLWRGLQRLHDFTAMYRLMTLAPQSTTYG
jgi:hypothetical protein